MQHMNNNQRQGEPTEERLPTGIVLWVLDNQIHREDGPAMIHPDGRQCWVVRNRNHRDDGPAKINHDGVEWRVHGHNITTAVEAWMQATGITWPFNEEALTQFRMTFCSSGGSPT